jgi:hypothetical protein
LALLTGTLAAAFVAGMALFAAHSWNIDLDAA